ncbi:MAG TPA: TonB-dependent receptor [Novosphingobium sp.]|nr:TonB-dependent receptor [Novosphingobium sp.]
MCAAALAGAAPAMAAASTAANTADAAASTAEAAPDSQGARQGLGEITVTAERRVISLQKAPIAISAINADSLKASNIVDVTGLNGSVPGLVVANSGGGEKMISIRGIGSQTPENTDTQPGVSYHVDGVYIFNSIAANAAFIDVAQVEVLRGPQGTMFGQGSTGGTINVVSNQPKLGKFSGEGEIGGGNYGYFMGKGAINVPIGDTIAIRAAIDHVGHEGYSKVSSVAGNANFREDDANNTGWRVSALWQPAPNFSLTFNTIQYRSLTHGQAMKNALDPNSDPREVTQDYPGRTYISTALYSLTAKWDTPFATVRSITSYQNMHSELSWDADGLTPSLFYAETYSPATYVGYNYDHVALWQSDVNSVTQEVNLTSNRKGPLEWIVGGVYLHSKNTQYINEYKADDSNPLRPALAESTAYNDAAVSALTYADLAEITREEEAAYFQLTWNATDKLTFIGGARFNHDRYTGAADSFSNGTPDVTSGAYLQMKPTKGYATSVWTGKAAVQYKLTPTNMVYFSYTRGFKPGGINATASAGGSDLIDANYKPEIVDSLEIGSKNRFMGDTLQFNASGFYYFYKDMQFLDSDPQLYGYGISNVGLAHIYGLELETAWLPSKHWKLEGSASFLHGEVASHTTGLEAGQALAAQDAAGYTGYLYWYNTTAAAAARAGAEQDLYGKKVPGMPSLQGNIALSYMNRVGPGDLTARIQYLYRGGYQARVFNTAFDAVPAYDQVNLMLHYKPDHLPIDITLRVTNLFNEAGVNSRYTDPYGSAQSFTTYIPPRQFIGSVGFRF